jgi:hypothetical protein
VFLFLWKKKRSEENHFFKRFSLRSPLPPPTKLKFFTMPSHLSAPNGGVQKKRKPARPLKPSLEPLPLASSSNGGIKNSTSPAAATRDGESSFARALASGDASTRLRALDALVAWLVAKGKAQQKSCSGAAAVSREDMRKLWKGMFYSYWHSDLAPVQVSH